MTRNTATLARPLRPSARGAAAPAIEDAFRLTGFFFARHVYEPRGIEPPGARAGFLAALRKHHAASKEIGADTAAGEIIT